MKISNTLVVLLSSVSIVLAAPGDLTAMDVWAPKILDPTAATMWQVGGRYYVKWALDKKPVNVTNPVGTVYLSRNGTLYMGTLTFTAMTVQGHSTSLFSERPLAQGFDLTDGMISVTVPAATVPGSSYAVVRMYPFLPPLRMSSAPRSPAHSFVHSRGRFWRQKPNLYHHVTGCRPMRMGWNISLDTMPRAQPRIRRRSVASRSLSFGPFCSRTWNFPYNYMILRRCTDFVTRTLQCAYPTTASECTLCLITPGSYSFPQHVTLCCVNPYDVDGSPHRPAVESLMA